MSFRKHLPAAEKAKLVDHGSWHGKGNINEEAKERAYSRTIVYRYLNLFPKQHRVLAGTISVIAVTIAAANLLIVPSK